VAHCSWARCAAGWLWTAPLAASGLRAGRSWGRAQARPPAAGLRLLQAAPRKRTPLCSLFRCEVPRPHFCVHHELSPPLCLAVVLEGALMRPRRVPLAHMITAAPQEALPNPTH
jgi:hypothetical protein